MSKNKIIKNTEKEIKVFGIPAEIALYYGFTPILPPNISKEDVNIAKSIGDSGAFGRRRNPEIPAIITEEKISILRHYIESGFENSGNQPFMFFFQGMQPKENKSEKYGKMTRFNLEIIGTNKSIAEAILIETVVAILTEEGFKNLDVEINTIGDKDASFKFGKELINHYRKYISQISAECRQTMKENIFDLLDCGHSVCGPINDEAPKSMSFLSETSRLHFKEILEYLESLGLPYVVTNKLVGNKYISTETVFSIYGNRGGKDERQLLAYGTRYNSLGKKSGSKREIHSVGITAVYSPIKAIKKTPIKPKKPKVYFIQIGFDAKLRSLKVMEVMRSAKIPVYQSLSKDKISVQIVQAEKMKVPLIVVMGQLEALSDSVIVRTSSTRSQETIKISELAGYIKKLKI